jgi:hypothetical protein
VRALVPAGRRAVRGRVRRGDPLLVRGWAFDGDGPAAFDGLEVRFPDGSAFDAVGGLARPDVSAAFGLPAELAPGFVAVVPTEAFPPGPLSGEIHGLRAGRPALAVGRFAVTVAGGRRQVDLIPGVGSERVVLDPPLIDRGGALPVLTLRGWALDGQARPGRRVVVALGAFGVEAVYGYPRPDVCAALGLSSLSEACGFELRLPCDELDGPGSAVAHLDDLDGLRSSSRPVPLPAELDFAPLAAPLARGAIDELHVIDPRNVVRQRAGAVAAQAGDRLVLSGWAAHEGEPAAELVAVLDGTRRHPVARRAERFDVAAAGLGPPDAGFIVTIPLDGLSAGPHEVEIFVRRPDGVLVPTAARATVQVG